MCDSAIIQVFNNKYFILQLSNIEKGTLQLNTFVAIKLVYDLQKATNTTKKLYGADVLVTYDLVKELLNYEARVHGLNLTHSQDKDYISNLVHSISAVLLEKHKSHWKRIQQLTGESAENLIGFIEKYINVLSMSQHDTYTNPFEIVSPNMGKFEIKLPSLYVLSQILEAH